MLPFWIADMDFKAPPVVLEALQKRLNHGIFGYTYCPESLVEALQHWFERRHGWLIEKENLLEIPGTVPFIHLFIQHFSEPGEAILIQEPVYYPFRMAVERNGRQVVSNNLKQDESGRWVMDLDNLERLIKQHKASLMIFCSPHNPVGRVWSCDELKTLATICKDADITLISDEIHADLVHPGREHIPWLTLPAEKLPRSLSLISATKSFNLPGLTTAWAVVNNRQLYSKTAKALEASGFSNGASAPLSYAATEAAWRQGEPWLTDLLKYVGANHQLMKDFFAARIPQLKTSALEGTYLAWIDARALEISDDELFDRLIKAGVWLSRGSQFGRTGEGFLRMNLACPQSQLEEGLERMAAALGGIV